jgi:radical SAM superfamily enzyme YgiQ (UPF0313 family)
MKIQFINALLGGDYSALDISITNLATYLNKKTKHRASILDLTFHTKQWKEHIANGIKAFKPDIIGISCNTMYMQYVKKIISEIKKKYHLPVILGGYHASIKPEETLNMDACDAVCIGDGEYALTEYLNRLETNKSLKGIPGIWVKTKGKIIRNKGGYFIQDIDKLPIPDWNLWKDLDKYFYYLGMLYFIGTRGCPYQCSYCDAHGIKQAVAGSYYRARDPIAYAREIAYQYRIYKNRGVRLAQLFDQVFSMNETWITKFCNEYKKQGIAGVFKFSTFSRIDHLNEKKFKILKEGGCAILRVGVEAGDSYIRNTVYKKNISNEQIKKIFTMGRKYGIKFTAFYILGGPGETRKTTNKTINLARQINADRSAFFIYKPFTDEGVKQITQFGGEIDLKRWAKADNITYGAVVRLKDLSPKQTEILQAKAYFLTFGKRLLRMIREQKLKYFIQFIAYVSKGIQDGLDIRYVLPYFHIYGYDNVKK